MSNETTMSGTHTPEQWDEQSSGPLARAGDAILTSAGTATIVAVHGDQAQYCHTDNEIVCVWDPRDASWTELPWRAAAPKTEAALRELVAWVTGKGAGDTATPGDCHAGLAAVESARAALVLAEPQP